MAVQVIASAATNTASPAGTATTVATPVVGCVAGDLLLLDISFWSPAGYVVAANVTVPGYTFRDRTDGYFGGGASNGFNSMLFTRTATNDDTTNSSVTVTTTHPCYGIDAFAYVVRGHDIDMAQLIINSSLRGMALTSKFRR